MMDVARERKGGDELCGGPSFLHHQENDWKEVIGRRELPMSNFCCVTVHVAFSLSSNGIGQCHESVNAFELECYPHTLTMSTNKKHL